MASPQLCALSQPCCPHRRVHVSSCRSGAPPGTRGTPRSQRLTPSPAAHLAELLPKTVPTLCGAMCSHRYYASSYYCPLPEEFLPLPPPPCKKSHFLQSSASLISGITFSLLFCTKDISHCLLSDYKALNSVTPITDSLLTAWRLLCPFCR